jgi:NOL1/NOP2/sun family putative RNA methylase
MNKNKIPEMKPLFIERMKKLLSKEDWEKYLEILKEKPVNSIRCNTLKISPEKLKKKLEEKNWKINQPWKTNPEVMIIENNLMPGEIGRAIEHLLGYYYVQELASMLPIITLKPKQNEKFLDLCASPGSKTTQSIAEMKNTGLVLANEPASSRVNVLKSNIERCGGTNVIITKNDGILLCKSLLENNFEFDKILVDAPCSGEGTLRSTHETYLMWNIKTVENLSKLQRQLAENAFELLKIDGEMIYSTCTHAPEENEEIVDYLLTKFKDRIEIIKPNLPIKSREGITTWENKKYSPKVKLCARVYPQDNNTEGFFVSQFRKLK